MSVQSEPSGEKKMQAKAAATVIEQVSAEATRISFEDLPDTTLHATKRVLLDWFAATIPAIETDYAKALLAATSQDLGSGASNVFRHGSKVPSRAAAFINGTLSHVVEFDDIFRDAIYHPGCPVIASALALAQAENVSGRTLLLAIVNGYEISTRIGVAVQPEHYKNWHTTGTIGCFGAAAAAATVLGLDADGFAHALATAGTFTAGLQQAFRSDTMSKPLHAGRAAEAGVTAALLAREGFKGALDILEGEAGFGAATAAGKVDWAAATDGLYRRFNIEKVTVKNHACCGHIFAAADGALELRDRHAIRPEDIDRILVATYGTALKVVGGREVNTPFQGKFNLAFVVASILIHGSIRLDAFSPQRLADPQAHRLMERLELKEDPTLTALYPRQRAARLEIVLRDGACHVHFQKHRKGDPELPLTDDELVAKFTELAEPVIGGERADRLKAQIFALEETRMGELCLNWA